jgi:hypothetical protein
MEGFFDARNIGNRCTTAISSKKQRILSLSKGGLFSNTSLFQQNLGVLNMRFSPFIAAKK